MLGDPRERPPRSRCNRAGQRLVRRDRRCALDDRWHCPDGSGCSPLPPRDSPRLAWQLADKRASAARVAATSLILTSAQGSGSVPQTGGREAHGWPETAAQRAVRASQRVRSSLLVRTTSSALSRRRTGACWPPRASVSVCRIRRRTSEPEHLERAHSPCGAARRRPASQASGRAAVVSLVASAFA
jgi:hypothetical protein